MLTQYRETRMDPRRPLRRARRQDRPGRLASTRAQLVIGAGFLIFFVVFLLLLAAATKSVDPLSAINATSAIKDRSGKIVIHSARDAGCEERHFDNDSGRMTEISASCSTREFDDSSRPSVRGTTGRLNQIGKYFQNR
jgi:hypothetical protein